jgi:transposase-like protein
VNLRYCPVCRAEYAPGTERCHDCEVDLVDGLDGEPAREEGRPAEPLVTVAALDTPVKASIVASRIEAEGIPCYLADAETVAVYGLLSNALGGVKVQVRRSDAARAAEIARQASAQASRPPCPHCGSRNVGRAGFSVPAAILAVLTLGILALFMPVRWECSACARRWR